MAYLHRLIAAAFFMVVLAASSYAALPKEATWKDPQFPNSGPYSSASAACNGYVSGRASDPGWAVSLNGVTVNGSSAQCGIKLCQKPALTYCQDTTHVVYQSGSACPANSTDNGTDCTCNAPEYEEKDGQCRPKNPCPAGQHEEGGACVPDNCKPDEIRVNGVCVKEPPCPDGQVRVNGKCEPDKCPKKGTSAGDGWSMSSSATEYACESTGVSFEGSVQYCMIKVVNTMDVNYDGKTFYYGRGTYTGAQCSGGTGGGDGDTDPGNPDPGDPNPGDPDNPPKPPDPRPPGQPTPPKPDNPPPPPPPPVPPNPDGQCPDGSQRYSNGRCYAPTPDPQPPDENGICPPDTVKINGACVSPSPPGEPAPEEPDEDGGCPDGYYPASGGKVCIADPKPPTGGKCPAGFSLNSAGLCEWSGSRDPPGDPDGDGDGDGDGDNGFAGSCMAGFSCEGDAIFCAIAKEQHKRACKLFDDKSPESDLYEEYKGKTGDQTKDNPGNETIDIAGRIDSTDALGGGACIGDVNIYVWGTAVTLPLTKLCPVLAMLGNLLVAVSMLVALRIITRG